jgi:hypothetical protein
MSDFDHQLREHYEGQRLSADRARVILEAGREAARRRQTRRRWLIGLAALLVVCLGLAEMSRRIQRNALPQHGVLPMEVAATVQEFFSQPDYQLPRVSSVPGELTEWLRAQGAPASFELPPAFANLPSFGCRVFDVHGERVYLICFFLDGGAADGAAEGMMKKQMVVTAPDGTMMKKDRPLVHLVFAPRSAFRDPPVPGTTVPLPARGDWNFQTWSTDEVVYLVAAAAPAERLRDLAAAN